MIVRLQKRFILTAMTAVITVVLIIMSVIHITNYRRMVREAGATLELIEANGGFFPKPGEMGRNGKDKPLSLPERMSAEAPYQTRFFTVTLDNSGKVVTVNTGNVAAVVTAEAIIFAESVYQSSRSQGFQGSYYFRVGAGEKGTLVTFLDCSRDLNSFLSFLKISLYVSAAMIAGVFIIVLLLSKRAIRPMLDSYEKQKYFITNASHELKTPLAVIQANTEVLEMVHGESEWTQSIKNQISRLSDMTNSLIMLSRMEEEKNRYRMTAFSLSDAVAESTEPFQVPARHKELVLVSEIEPGLTYTGDESALRQLMGILLDNAVKYTDSQGYIKVSLKKRGRGFELCVSNEAKQMEPGEYPMFFERFYRHDSSHNQEDGGSGIGLSVARAIVMGHKGKIEAKCDGKREFTIRILL